MFPFIVQKQLFLICPSFYPINRATVDVLASVCKYSRSKMLKYYLAFYSLIRTFDLRSKVLSLENAQILFGILLAYSYLCPRYVHVE